MSHNWTIGSIIQEARKQMGYSVAEVADQCFLGHSHLRQIEANLRNLPPEAITRVCFMLHLDMKHMARLVLKESAYAECLRILEYEE